jgi:hypothetical protein
MVNPLPGHAKKWEKRFQRMTTKLVDKKAYKEKCELAMSSPRNLRTFKDMVTLGEDLINAKISGALDNKDAASLGYLMAIQQQNIKLEKFSEHDPSSLLSDKFDNPECEITVTREELRKLARANSVNIMINLLNKVAEKPAIDVEPIMKRLPPKEIEVLPPEQRTILRGAYMLENACKKLGRPPNKKIQLPDPEDIDDEDYSL